MQEIQTQLYTSYKHQRKETEDSGVAGGGGGGDTSISVSHLLTGWDRLCHFNTFSRSQQPSSPTRKEPYPFFSLLSLTHFFKTPLSGGVFQFFWVNQNCVLVGPSSSNGLLFGKALPVLLFRIHAWKTLHHATVRETC